MIHLDTAKETFDENQLGVASHHDCLKKIKSFFLNNCYRDKFFADSKGNNNKSTREGKQGITRII
jgi:hypothetical protein